MEAGEKIQARIEEATISRQVRRMPNSLHFAGRYQTPKIGNPPAVDWTDWYRFR